MPFRGFRPAWNLARLSWLVAGSLLSWWAESSGLGGGVRGDPPAGVSRERTCLWGPWRLGTGQVGDRGPALVPAWGRSVPHAHGLPCLQKLEEQDRRALSIKEQLQREHRFLKRRLEQLSVQSLERVRTDSTGSAVSTDDSEQGGHGLRAAPWQGGWGEGWEAGAAAWERAGASATACPHAV